MGVLFVPVEVLAGVAEAAAGAAPAVAGAAADAEGDAEGDAEASRFAELVKKEIFEPLGLRSSSIGGMKMDEDGQQWWGQWWGMGKKCCWIEVGDLKHSWTYLGAMTSWVLFESYAVSGFFNIS